MIGTDEMFLPLHENNVIGLVRAPAVLQRSLVFMPTVQIKIRLMKHAVWSYTDLHCHFSACCVSTTLKLQYVGCFFGFFFFKKPQLMSSAN